MSEKIKDLEEIPDKYKTAMSIALHMEVRKLQSENDKLKELCERMKYYMVHHADCLYAAGETCNCDLMNLVEAYEAFKKGKSSTTKSE